MPLNVYRSTFSLPIWSDTAIWAVMFTPFCHTCTVAVPVVPEGISPVSSVSKTRGVLLTTMSSALCPSSPGMPCSPGSPLMLPTSVHLSVPATHRSPFPSSQPSPASAAVTRQSQSGALKKQATEGALVSSLSAEHLSAGKSAAESTST